MNTPISTSQSTGASTRVLVTTTAVLFVGMTGVLGWFDMLPESPKAAARAAVEAAIEFSSEKAPAIPEAPNPTRVIIDSINVDSPVNNPASTNSAVLDEALRSGVVHYPGSADMDERGNVLLFGHSSSLPIVHNKNYKIFNRVNELSKGDAIIVQSSTHEYVYEVNSVRMGKAEDIHVTFDTDTRRLTISTCNSFGSTDERWIVEADLIEFRPLANTS
jgi:LPXTG-site transpeptidase (sortase) family protein